MLQHQPTCMMDARELKCTKCICNKQGCFWNHISLLGWIKKEFEEEFEEKEESDDEEVQEVRCPRIDET